MYLIKTCYSYIKNISLFVSIDFVKNFIKEKIFVLVYSSGVSVNILGVEIPAIGISWFLVVLFLGRTLFDYLNLRFGRKKAYISSCILSVIGILFGKVQWLPLSFDIALAILPFFAIGKEFYRLNVNVKSLKKLTISILIWGSGLFVSYMLTNSYMELTYRRYTLFPLCYITAIAGTLMVSEVSVILCKSKIIANPICYLGENSLYMLCIHIFDNALPIWKISENLILNSLSRVIMDVIIFVILTFILEKLVIRKEIN